MQGHRPVFAAGLEGFIMGLRFRKSIKLFPGVRINLSKSGISTSIGKPGATVNLSERGARGTVGIPGTGLSYSERLTADADPSPARPASGMSFGALLGWALLGLIVAMVVLGLLGLI
jgi:hypothetical protein